MLHFYAMFCMCVMYLCMTCMRCTYVLRVRLLCMLCMKHFGVQKSCFMDTDCLLRVVNCYLPLWQMWGLKGSVYLVWTLNNSICFFIYQRENYKFSCPKIFLNVIKVSFLKLYCFCIILLSQLTPNTFNKGRFSWKNFQVAGMEHRTSSSWVNSANH